MAAEQCVLRRGVVLASFVAQVRGVLLNDCPLGGLHVGCSVKLVRRPDSRYDVNCIAVMVERYRSFYLLGHLEASVAAILSPVLLRGALSATG